MEAKFQKEKLGVFLERRGNWVVEERTELKEEEEEEYVMKVMKSSVH